MPRIPEGEAERRLRAVVENDSLPDALATLDTSEQSLVLFLNRRGIIGPWPVKQVMAKRALGEMAEVRP